MSSAAERVSEAPSSGPLAFFASPMEGVRNEVRGPATAADWLRYGALAAELLLVVLVVDRFQIESRAFGTLTRLALGGFLVHALLPARFRLAFFAVLSMAGLVLVLGPANAKWILGLGIALIALSHLPLPFAPLVALLLSAGAVLVVMRAGLVRNPWSAAIWPIFGSLFMFRLMVFVVDRKHGQRGRSVWETLSYFFLLPNVCFPLFPVIDYVAFRRSWYGQEAWSCYQTGVRWIARGLIHLLLYRLIYYYGSISPEEVASPGELVRYLVTNFGLYLRVSGIFHVAIGMLRLFGFALPESHFLYYLSSSINDFWRRINIYWKDYMLKFFYMPAFFKLRRGGEERALILSTLFVVLVTWALHSWQWFWLRGSFPVRWQDGVFWTVLGACMILNTLYENRTAGARGRRARTWTARNFAGQSLRILATYSFVCVLWSLWTCGSLASWLAMMSMSGSGATALQTTMGTVATLAGALLLVVGIEFLAGKNHASALLTTRNGALTALGLLGLLALGHPAVYSRLGTRMSEAVQSLRVAKLNRLDAASLQRGYYEDLLDVDRFNAELWRVYKSKPAGWLQLHETIALRRTDDFLLTELAPSQETPYKGAVLRTNEWGMRDRDYSVEKPEGTHRTALLGASYVMGSGVDNDQTFEALLEERLSAEGPGAPERTYEILNFAVGGYSPLQRLWMLEHRAPRFDPDMTLYVAHENETSRLVLHLAAAQDLGHPPPSEELRAIWDEAGVTDDMDEDDVVAALTPYEREILGWTYRRIADVSRGRGMTPVWVLLPTLEMHGTLEDIAWMLDLARAAGFEVVDLFGVYDGHDIFSIRVAPWDYHLNADGHALIAARLFDELVGRGVFE